MDRAGGGLVVARAGGGLVVARADGGLVVDRASHRLVMARAGRVAGVDRHRGTRSGLRRERSGRSTPAEAVLGLRHARLARPATVPARPSRQGGVAAVAELAVPIGVPAPVRVA
jgi:hypothetical protein